MKRWIAETYHHLFLTEEPRSIALRRAIVLIALLVSIALTAIGALGVRWMIFPFGSLGVALFIAMISSTDDSRETVELTDVSSVESLLGTSETWWSDGDVLTITSRSASGADHVWEVSTRNVLYKTTRANPRVQVSEHEVKTVERNAYGWVMSAETSISRNAVVWTPNARE